MLLPIECSLSDNEKLAMEGVSTVKCDWCGGTIRQAGAKLTFGMCQTCFTGMLSEFLSAQQMKPAPSHASDR